MEAKRAILVKRADEKEVVDMEELIELSKSAGFSIVSQVLQTREEDPEYNIGSGKLPDIHRIAEENDVDAVIFGNVLGPFQLYNIGVYLPEDIEVIDKYDLILKIFEQRADTKKAQLQVELASLRRELPRAETKVKLAKREEHPGFMGLGEYEEGEESDIKDRIARVRDKLEKIEETNKQRREYRRDSGFELVSLAGYTNAGKSTLLRRLSESMEVDMYEEMHPDLPRTAKSENKLFTTLNTTTRRMDFDKRNVLVTDTVGFIDDLPYWLIESFDATLDSVYHSDLVVLVIDISEPVDDIIDKIVTCHDKLSNRNKAPIITAFNKIDLIPEEEVDRKIENLKGIVDDYVRISAREGKGVNDLKQLVHNNLEVTEEERILLPLNGQSMSILSDIHDNAFVINEEFNNDSIIVEFEAKQETIQRIRSKVNNIATASD